MQHHLMGKFNLCKWRHLLAKFVTNKVTQVMVSTHGSVVLLAMFFFYAKIVNVYLAIVVIISEHKQGHDGRQ